MRLLVISAVIFAVAASSVAWAHEKKRPVLSKEYLFDYHYCDRGFSCGGA